MEAQEVYPGEALCGGIAGMTPPRAEQALGRWTSDIARVERSLLGRATDEVGVMK
jgi:hypothetical protein